MTDIDREAEDRETGDRWMPRFDDKGLITAVVTDHSDNMLLMVAHMNEAALNLTIETGEAHFFSRSRQSIWHKGATSGNVLKITDIRTDCDQDVVWLTAQAGGHGAACHTGRRSCFYRRIVGKGDDVRLELTGDPPLFDPNDVYGDP